MAEVATVISDKIEFKIKTVTRDKDTIIIEGQFTRKTQQL